MSEVTREQLQEALDYFDVMADAVREKTAEDWYAIRAYIANLVEALEEEHYCNTHEFIGEDRACRAGTCEVSRLIATRGKR